MNRSSNGWVSGSIAGEYQNRYERWFRDQQALEGRANRLSNWRAAAFLGGVAAIVAGLASGTSLLPWLVLGGMLLGGFIVLVRIHGRVMRELVRASRLADVNRHALARYLRRWDELPIVMPTVASEHQSVSKDLDLFGRASVYQLLPPPHTPAGVVALSSWLVEPARPAEIAARQQGVARLAPTLDWRQELDLAGRMLGADAMHPERFASWAEGEPWLTQRHWLVWLARVLPPLMLLLVIAQAVGFLAAPWWMPILILNISLSFFYCGRAHSIFNRISTRQGEIKRYGELFALAAQLPTGEVELERLRDELTHVGGGAHAELVHLGRIMDLADLRFSAMVYGVVQGLTLWDFHVLSAVERWQRRSGRFASRWFAALGRLEALSSLASLCHDHPSWSFPQVSADVEAVVKAEGLGHPLLAEESRVVNDCVVGPPGTFLLVSGSNMSGKSTLLRALGTNVVLAQAGAPVCAVRMTLPPVRMATSMRVQDSLEDGVSFFLAELKRLKQAVDAADRLAGQRDWRLLYLFDEILQGTNTVERQIAVRTVLKHLLAMGAIGAVSTHDLDLANSPELAEACRSVHFRESFEDGPDCRRMTFDYLLRPGIATTTNALKLLEMVGLAERGGE